MKNRREKATVNHLNSKEAEGSAHASPANKNSELSNSGSFIIDRIRTLIGLNQMTANLIGSNLSSMLNLGYQDILPKNYLNALRDKSDINRLFVPIPMRFQETVASRPRNEGHKDKVHLQSLSTNFENGQLNFRFPTQTN